MSKMDIQIKRSVLKGVTGNVWWFQNHFFKLLNNKDKNVNKILP